MPAATWHKSVSYRKRMAIVDETEQDEPKGGTARAGSAAAPRHSRRLSDKILIAFHHACDQGDFEVAEKLLGIVEMMLTRRPTSPDTNRRRHLESLVAAHERLWHLRHPEPVDR
jgi:hypothetical protein